MTLSFDDLESIKGNRIGLFSENSVEMASLLLAVHRALDAYYDPDDNCYGNNEAIRTTCEALLGRKDRLNRR